MNVKVVSPLSNKCIWGLKEGFRNKYQPLDRIQGSKIAQNELLEKLKSDMARHATYQARRAARKILKARRASLARRLLELSV